MKRSILGSEDQRSRSYEVKDRFGGLAEASFSTSLGRVFFLVVLYLFEISLLCCYNIDCKTYINF